MNTKLRVTLALAAGFAMGWVMCKNRLEQHFIDIANEEIAAMEQKLRDEWTVKQFPEDGATEDDEAYESVVDNVKATAAEAASALVSYQTGVVNVEPEYPKSYIITDLQFLESPDEYEQTTVKYFPEDGVFVDSGDNKVSDEMVQKHIGVEHLEHFDENGVLYVRNDRIKMDFEIIREEGSYAKVVLGE